MGSAARESEVGPLAPGAAPCPPPAPALTRRALALRAGHDQLTDSRGFRELPRGCYDVGDGYLNPVDNLVYQYRTSAVRRPQYKRVLECLSRYGIR